MNIYLSVPEISTVNLVESGWHYKRVREIIEIILHETPNRNEGMDSVKGDGCKVPSISFVWKMGQTWRLW